MYLFNLVVGIFSIIGAVASLFTATYVIKITRMFDINNSHKIKQTAIGKDNVQAGGNAHVSK